MQLCETLTMAVTGVTEGGGWKALISQRAKQTLKLGKVARPSYCVNMFFHGSIESLLPDFLERFDKLSVEFPSR